MSQEILGNGDSGLEARTKINNNFSELYQADADASAALLATLADSTFVEKSGVSNYRFGKQYSQIDSTLTGSWVFDGTDAFPNKLGVNNTKPIIEPATGARSLDTGYVTGDAEVACIAGGYDNVCNALAGYICSQHSMIYSGATHAAIIGGSLHTIKSGSDYAIIAGGSSCTIEDDCDYAGIYNSDQCIIKYDPDISKRGFRSSIVGSALVTVRARNVSVYQSANCTVDGAYSVLVNCDTVSLASGLRVFACASNSTIGNLAAASYSIVFGDGHLINGARTFAYGDGHVIGAGHDYSMAQGTKCVTPCASSRVASGRHRGNVAGNNQLLELTMSQETTNTTVTRLSLAGSFTFPTQPVNSVVNGTIWVTGVSDAGVVSAFKIDFVSKRTTDTPTLHANATTTVFNDLALGTVPTINVTSGGIYRVQVVGLAATNIRWTANMLGNQTVFA